MAEYDAFLKRDEASPQKRRPTTAPAALDQQPGGERKPSVKEIIRSSRAARAGKLKKGIEVQRGRAALSAPPPDPPPRVEPKRRKELLSWLLARRLRAWRRRVERRASRASRKGRSRYSRGSIDTATTGDESTAMASNEEIADDAALAGQADAFTPVWKSTSGDVESEI